MEKALYLRLSTIHVFILDGVVAMSVRVNTKVPGSYSTMDLLLPFFFLFCFVLFAYLFLLFFVFVCF